MYDVLRPRFKPDEWFDAALPERSDRASRQGGVRAFVAAVERSEYVVYGSTK
jgi:hypothetical protein